MSWVARFLAGLVVHRFFQSSKRRLRRDFFYLTTEWAKKVGSAFFNLAQLPLEYIVVDAFDHTETF